MPIKQLRTGALQFGLKGGPFGVASVTQHPSGSHDALLGSARSGLLRRPNRQRVHQLVNGVQVLRRLCCNFRTMASRVVMAVGGLEVVVR